MQPATVTSDAPRCENCGGLLSRPGLFGCRKRHHRKPTLAERIARAIEADICDRRGLRQEFESIAPDLQDEIRDRWAKMINRELRCANRAAPDMLAALQRQHANINRWLETGIPADAEESRSIAEQIAAAIRKATGEQA